MRFLLTDLRQAVRGFRTNPSFTAVAVATLGLGIGATTALFSVVDGVLLEPLPLHRPSEIVMVGHQYQGAVALKTGVSAAGFRFYREQSRVLSSGAAMTRWEANYSAGEEPVRLRGQRVTHEYFTTLGVPMVAGRGFAEAEEKAGADRVVVLSEATWRRLFGADPTVVGRTITLNGEGHLVIGIVARGLEMGREPTELWKPLVFSERDLSCWGCEWMGMVGRLKPGVTIAAARVDADRMAAAVREINGSGRDQAWGLWTNPVTDEMVGDVRTPLFVLLAAVGFVLLIACVNVANLLLARATTRKREVAIRTSLGAGRGRLVGQLLTESVVLAGAGTGLGLLLAAGSLRALRAINPTNLPRLDGIDLDGGVVGFAVLLGLVTPILFGLGPAWYAVRGELFGLVKAGGRESGEGLGRVGPRAVLVAAEVALALMLLVGAGLMIRSMRAWVSVDSGFRADSLLTFRVSLPRAGYPTVAQQVGFHDRLRERLLAVPGVRGVGATVALPMGTDNWTMSFRVEGYEPGPGGQSPWGEFRVVTPGFMEAMGFRLVRGRVFETVDDAAARRVAVVDESLVERYWPGQDPLGKRVGFERNDSTVWHEVVGVVGHVISESPQADRRTQLYVPAAQAPGGGPATMTYAVRATAIDRMIPEVGRAVRAVDPVQPIFDVRPMTAWVSASSANQRFLLATLAVFAGTALVLAAIGIYGLMSFAVSQATREIGIRLALGAPRGAVRRLVLRRALTLMAAGGVVGIGGALALSRGLRSQLFGVAPWDPATLLVTAAALGVVAFAAGWVPARRATRVEPITALRAE